MTRFSEFTPSLIRLGEKDRRRLGKLLGRVEFIGRSVETPAGGCDPEAILPHVDRTIVDVGCEVSERFWARAADQHDDFEEVVAVVERERYDG